MKKKFLGQLVVDGYFYDKFFISVNGKKMVVDLHKKTFKGDMEAFSMGKAHNSSFDNEYFSDKNVTVTIGWKTNNNETFVDVLFFANPQIENGIRFRTNASIKGAVGMLIDNYKPCLMLVPTLDTCSYAKIETRLKSNCDKHQNKSIIMENEKWSRV